MSNIAGKAYAMNVITPIKIGFFYMNIFIFWLLRRLYAFRFRTTKDGLSTLSLIHYAHWAIVNRKQLPHLHTEQPREDLKHNYMFFFSNFNGSWEQYVDSFHKSIPSGLDLLWNSNVNYPKAIPLTPFHAYINHNQIRTSHYYNAYPNASANDVKAAKRVRSELMAFQNTLPSLTSDQDFQQAYEQMLSRLQHDVSLMEDTPVVSLATQANIDRQIRISDMSSPFASSFSDDTQDLTTTNTCPEYGRQS